MNLNGNINSQKTQKNLKTLLLCSKLKTIQLSTEEGKIRFKQLKRLADPRNQELNDLLRNAYLEESRQNGNSYVDTFSDNQHLANFYLPIDKELEIPEHLKNAYKNHKANASRLNYLERSLNEHEELRNILAGQNSPSGKANLYEINKFLNDKTHTGKFKEFAERMKTGNASIILLQYKHQAAKLAKDENIISTAFVDNLNKAFSIDDVITGINQDIKGRFISTGKKIAIVAGIAGVAIGSSIGLLKGINQSTAPQPTSSQAVETQPDQKNLATEPIYVDKTFSSYSDAVEDFLEITAKKYKQDTGKNIDISDLKYDDIGQGNTDIYTATLGNQTYQFSTISEFGSNYINLENALTAVGATITKSEDTITYLSRDNKSIAICDSDGNPVKSGNITEATLDGSSQMYNQRYINSARNMMIENGIDPAGKTEAELIGYYLFNNNDQDPELSRALGYTSKLVSYMKNHFGYGEQAPTLDGYKNLSVEATYNLYGNKPVENSDDFER